MRAAIDKAASHAGSTLGDDPAAAAAVHQMLGAIYFGQDKHDAAVAEFEKSRALYRSLGGRHAAALVQVETALCDVHRIGDHLVEAEAACDSALRHARESDSGLALATLKLGQLRGEQGRYPQAQAILQPLLRDKAFAADPKALGELHWALGLGARALGRYPQAREHFEALLAISREGGQPGSWTAWAYNSLGSVLVELGDYERADVMLLAARRLFVESQGADQVEAQMPQAWRADIRLRRGQWSEAKTLLRGMLHAWDGKLQPGHSLRLRAEASLAWAEAMSGERELAARSLQRAIDARAITFEKPDDRTAAVRTLRWVRAALALDDQARAGELLALFDARLRPTLADPHPMRAEADCLRAQWARRGGDEDAARRLATSCRNGFAKFYPATHPLVAEAGALSASLERAVPRLPDAG
jgi:non-specific serine/threonine protein kinase